jgi:hypothetical protein
MSKYQIWYDAIILKARDRVIPTCYTEVHHILPRSLGGGDHTDNLVRLTYREHFVVHWLLTRICSGGDLRRMQYALWAMTIPKQGKRITSGWQFDAAKRAIRDLELDPVAEAAWRKSNLERALMEQAESWCAEYNRNVTRPDLRIDNRVKVEAAVKSSPRKLRREDLSHLASTFLKDTKRMNSRHVRQYLSKADVADRGSTS